MISLPLPQNNRVLFLDMNAFFASCEQFKNPELRGKPVGVTPTLANSGCVIAASYEAKKLGVTTGCSVGYARQKIAQIKIVQAVPKDYVTIHHRICDFLNDCIGPNINRLSIDEFAVDLDKNEQFTPNAHAVANKIKAFLTTEFSGAITGSIGIGPNTFLAKLATDIQKPDGLAIIQTHTITDALKQFCLTDLPGISHGMDRRLRMLGVRTPVQFAQMSQSILKQAFGVSGTAWWHALRGYTIGSVLPGSAFGLGQSLAQTKSVGHSHVLAPDLRTKAKARAVLYKLWIKVVDRLRAKQLGAKQVFMGARSRDKKWGCTITIQATQNVFRVFQAITFDYDQLPDSFAPLQMFVVVFDLEPHNPRHPRLLTDNEPKIANAFAAIEKMNTRYGRWTVKPASLLIAGAAAPNRIAFHAPDYAMD